MADPLSFADFLRRLRGDRSQSEFARELGIDQSQLSRLEGGKNETVPVSVVESCLALHLERSGKGGLDALLAQIRHGRGRDDRELIRRAILQLANSLKP
jgi:transcriptional regulator with XRE-family HTH domain